MKRSEMIGYIQRAEGVPSQMKAAAILGVSLMPKDELPRFSAIADRGLKMIEAGDYEGVMALLAEVDAPPDVIAAARTLLASLVTHADKNTPAL